MGLSAHIRLREKPSRELRRKLKKYSEGDDDYIYWDLSQGAENFFRSYELIRAAGNDFLLPRFHVNDDGDVFPEDRKQIVGYVAESLDMVGLRNPPEDYRRPPRGPNPTGLKDDVEMDLEDRPKGLFITAADEYIVHDDWLEYFASPAMQPMKTIRYRGKPLPNWNRLRVLRKDKVIDDICFAWTFSAFSGEPLVASLGEVWFSATGEVITETMFNTLAAQDYGEGHLIVISAEALARFRKVHRLQRAGLRPLTVYTKATRRYEMISKLQLAIKHITEQKRKEVEAGPGQPTITKEQLEGLKGLWQLFSGGK